MEKSIEERAKSLADWILRREGCLKYVGLTELLEKEFKDQKAIYDKAMDMLNEACDNTIALLKEEHKRELNGLIDKACELFRKECEEANGLIKSVCDRNVGDLINVDASVKSFRKKLEE